MGWQGGIIPPITFRKQSIGNFLTNSTAIYTVLHIFRQVLLGAENQGNHQNFEKSLLSLCPFEKKNQNGRLKKTEVSTPPIFNILSLKFH